MKKKQLEKLLRKVFKGFRITEESFQKRLDAWWIRFEYYEVDRLEAAFKYLPELSSPYRPPLISEAVICLEISEYFGGVN